MCCRRAVVPTALRKNKMYMAVSNALRAPPLEAEPVCIDKRAGKNVA
jgi:hypothetical protein